MGTKSTKEQIYVLDVSEYFFRLTTECLRYYSNETTAYQTLAALVSMRLAVTPSVERHEVETMREHFTAIPTFGNVKVHLEISDENAVTLERIRHELGIRLNACLTLGDALSALLFDYVVEMETARIWARIEREGLMPASDAIFIKIPMH